MTRPTRCEFQGAIYLVTLSGYPGGHVFYDPGIFKQHPENPRGHAPGAEHFERLLWDVCEQYDARVHAYVMEPNVALVVIQTHGAPLGWIAHDLLARFSMSLIERGRIPAGQRPFPRRYRAQPVQPAKLPYVVRFVQRREIPADPRRRAINHPFSSNLIYCGRRPKPDRFEVSAMQEALTPLGYLGPKAYFEFMSRGDSPAIAHMLSRRVIGERIFLEFLRERCRQPPSVPSPDELLREVTGALLHADPRIACASTHRGALARALVAWYAMRTGAAQIGTVGGWFGVTGSDLRYLICRHRRQSPRYFSVPTAELFPRLSAPPAEARCANRGATPRTGNGAATPLHMGP